MEIAISRVVCGAYQENAYILRPLDADVCVLVDPGDDLDALEAALPCAPAAICLTHGHFDHTVAAKPLAETYHCPIYLHPGDFDMLCDSSRNAYDAAFGAVSLPCPTGLDPLPYPQELLALAGMSLRVLHTPGHTPGGVCLYLEEIRTLLTGDTLFADGFGRMDLPGGSLMQMRKSLKMLFDMPEDIRLLPGHGEESTIGQARGRYIR